MGKDYKYGEWISVEDKLPEGSGSYLVCIPNTNYPGVHYALDNYWPGVGFSNTKITDWCPLPPPPFKD